MLDGTMATAKGKATGGRGKAGAKGKATPATKPSLTEIGREAQREALMRELKANAWNLTATARELGLTGPSNVIRALKTLGLEDELEAARSRGDIAPGRPT